MSFLPPIKGITKYYHAGDFHRWWYWLWFNKAIRALHVEFFSMKGFGEAKHYDPTLRHLPDHERFWHSHCFNCNRWLVSANGLCAEPSEKAMQVLGYSRVKLAGSERYLCYNCTGIYNQGYENGKL